MISMIIVISFLLLTLVLSLKWWRYYYLALKLPGPRGLPLLGNVMNFRNHNHKLIYDEIDNIIKIHGPITRIWLGPVMVILVAGTDEIAKVVENDKIGHRGQNTSRILGPMFNKGLLTIDDMDEWRKHRKIVANALHKNTLKKFVEIFSKNSMIMANRLRDLADGKEFHELFPHFYRCTLDIISQTCFASNLNAQVNNDMELVEHNEIVLDSTQMRISSPILLFDWSFYLTKLGKRYKATMKYYHELINKVIDERNERAKTEEEMNKRPTLIDFLILNGQLSREEIVGEVTSVGGAGAYTTASITTFVLAILAEHQDIQEKVVEEQRVIFGEKFLRPVTSNDLPSMTYLEQELSHRDNMISMIILICFLLLTVILSFKWWRYYYFGFKLPGPRGLPLLGNLMDFRIHDQKAFFHELNNVIKIHGPIARIWLGPVMVILVAGADEIASVVENDKNGHRGRYSSRIFGEIFNNGLLVLEDMNEWRKHHKIVENALHNNTLNKFVENFSKNSMIMANRLRDLADGKMFHVVLPQLYQCTLDIICQTCFALNLNAQVNNDMEPVEYNDVILNSTQMKITVPILQFDWPFYLTKLGKRYKAAMKYYHDLINKVIDGRIESARTEEEINKKPTMIDYLTLNGQLSREEIVGEITSLGGAGAHATATVSNFILAILAEHQDIQEKVMEEQRVIFGEEFLRPVTSDDLPSMTYLEQVINETLRLYLPLIGHMRETTKEYDIGHGHIVPKGAQLFVCAYILHRDPKHYPDPERFDPDRFLPENVAARHPYAFTPFGIGRRFCVGYKFAYMEIKTMLSTILRHYNIFEVQGGMKHIDENMYGLFRRVTNGINLKFTPRCDFKKKL